MDIPLFAGNNVGGGMCGPQPVCEQLSAQPDRQMSATCFPIEGFGNSWEEVALSGIGDVLTWQHAVKPSQDSDYLRPGQSVIVYPKFLDKLDYILSSGEIGSDPIQSRRPAYEAILIPSMTRPGGSRPIMLPEGYPRLSPWPIIALEAAECMEDAKRITVAGYRQVFEDDRDLCEYESGAE
jgi:hypothetical protein